MSLSVSPRPLRARALPAACLLALGAAAHAQSTLPQPPLAQPQAERGSSPFYVGASQAFSRSSNIFRAPKGTPETDDTVSTTSLLAGIDQPFGRQRVRADVAVRHNKFNDQDQLDNTGYRLGGDLDWETAGRISGNVSLAAQQNLARYGVEGTVNTTERNIERARQFGATVQYGGPSILAIYGLYDHRSIDYSLPAFNSLEYERDQIGVGMRYRLSGALTLGAEARTGQGEYPNARGGLGDEFDRNELALTALWVPTGASRLSARVAATDQEHDIEARSFSGITGALNWDYRPTGKLRFATELRRDTGQESDPLRLAGVIDAIGDNSEVSNRLQVRAFYEATAKIQLDGLLRYTRRSLVDTLTLPGVAISSAGHDATTFVSFGARYQPTRTIELGCSIGREDRSADSNVSFAYRVDTASCFAQVLLNPF